MEPEPQPLKKRRKKRNILERKTYEIEDNSLAERSRTWHLLFLGRVAAFEAFDPELNATYAANWLLLIEQFEKQSRDKIERNEVTITTNEVRDKTDAVLRQIDSLEYFVKKAFPDNGRMLMEFGFDKLSRPKDTGIARFLISAKVARKVLNDYVLPLTAADMPVTLPADLENAINELVDAEVNQEYQKSLRIRSTTKRIELFNALYDTFMKVHKAAHVIYHDQPVQSQLFDL